MELQHGPVRMICVINVTTVIKTSAWHATWDSIVLAMAECLMSCQLWCRALSGIGAAGFFQTMLYKF